MPSLILHKAKTRNVGFTVADENNIFEWHGSIFRRDVFIYLIMIKDIMNAFINSKKVLRLVV